MGVGQSRIQREGPTKMIASFVILSLFLKRQTEVKMDTGCIRFDLEHSLKMTDFRVQATLLHQCLSKCELGLAMTSPMQWSV